MYVGTEVWKRWKFAGGVINTILHGGGGETCLICQSSVAHERLVGMRCGEIR